MIDSNGGVVENDGVTLDFAEESIEGDGVGITVVQSDETQVEGYDLYSPIYLWSGGHHFFPSQRTVEVKAGEDADKAAMFWSRADEEGYDQIGGEVVSTADGYVVVAQVYHFSTYR